MYKRQVEDNVFCNSPWSPQIEYTRLYSLINYQEVTCAYYRPFESYSTGYYEPIRYGEAIEFLTGFNVYSSANDGFPDASDYSEAITVILVEAAQAYNAIFSVVTAVILSITLV